MKRASDVPPEVESSGLCPVSAAMASAVRSVKGEVGDSHDGALQGRNASG